MLGMMVLGAGDLSVLLGGDGHFLGAALAAGCKLQCFAVSIFNGNSEPKQE